MVLSGSIGCIRSNIWENMPPSDRIPFRCSCSLAGSSFRSLHIHLGSPTPELRATDLMASSCLRHSSSVRSRRSISSRASTTRSGSWLSITSFSATTAARSSPYAQSALAFKSRSPLARPPPFSRWSLHAAFNPSGHRPQLVEFPCLHLVVAVLRGTRRITSGHRGIVSCQRFDALPRVAERLRQRAGVETGRVPVRLVHEHAGERCGHE